MTFDEILTQVHELLGRQGRVSYRALKRRFDLDDDYLEDVKAEIIQAKSWPRTRMVPCWSGLGCRHGHGAGGNHKRDPLSYTPIYLAEKIFISRRRWRASASK